MDIQKSKPHLLLTLVFISQPPQILLGFKKRGFGVNKYNGFGGKVHLHKETISQSAIRELQEESSLQVQQQDLQFVGLLTFDYDDKHKLYQVHVFKSYNYQGQLEESEEMKPQWFDQQNLPFSQMWIDDQYWMPHLLQNQCFNGYFRFQGDQIVEHQLQQVSYEQLIEKQTSIINYPM